MVRNKRFGVALSGGGYRAAGFHLGTLKKLNDLDILNKIDVLSTISGGSITGAAYCLHNGTFEEFEKEMLESLSQKSVVGYVLSSWQFLATAIPLVLLLLAPVVMSFTSWSAYALIPWVFLAFIIVRYQFKLLPLSEIIEKAYDTFFFKSATLEHLCTVPEIAINATNLQTVRHFTFSARKMGDSAYAFYNPPVLFLHKNFPVSRAVMASTCVPFAFTPISIEKKYYEDERLYGTVDPKLIDGGVYDNQGIHKLTQGNSSYACQIVLVSDAGNALPFQKAYNNTFTLLLRTVDTFMARIKNFQMMQSIFSKHHDREIAYLSLGWDVDQCVSGFFDNLVAGNIRKETIAAHCLKNEWIAQPKDYKSHIIDHLNRHIKTQSIEEKAVKGKRLQDIRKIGTNLTPIKKNLLEDMIMHSAAMTELQLRLYCPSVFDIESV